MNNQRNQGNQKTQGKATQQATQQEAQQGRQQRPPTQAPAVPVEPIVPQEMSIGLPDLFPVLDENKIYPTISEFLDNVDILMYESYVGELNTKNKETGEPDEYWAAEGIDHFAADLGIGVCELKVYELKDIWLVMAYARSVNDNRPSCAAVTHNKKDRHSLEKAVRRAGRNAIKYMIPLVLLKDMLEHAKIERDKRVALEASIKEAQKAAGTAMRENRSNFDNIATVNELLAFAEEKIGKVQDEWLPEDWNFLKTSVSDPNSLLLRQLGGEEVSEEEVVEQEEVTEEEEEEEQTEDEWEQMAEGIEESEEEDE